MNLLDVLILACMAFLIVRGIFRGFVREVGSLAGIVLGIWGACVYHPQMTEFLSRFLPAWKYLPLVSVALVIIVVLVGSNVAAWLVHKFLKKVFLGWADRTLGAGLAIFKGVVIIYFAIVLMTFFVPSTSSFIAGSRLKPAIVDSYRYIADLFSPEAYDNLKKTFMGHKEKIVNSLSKEKEQHAPDRKHDRR
jgi:membrane protein required for colicin V production